MELTEIAGTYSILRYPPEDKIPEWVLDLTGLVSVTRTDEELSVLCETEAVQGMPGSREDGWKCLRVRGVLDFSLTGILLSIAAPLAEQKISIFAVSTYDTDSILTKAEKFNDAKSALRKANFKIA